MQQRFLRMLEHLDCRLARDRGKALQKFVQPVIILEVLEQCLHWHPSRGENRTAAEDLRIDSHEIGRLHADIVDQMERTPRT